ncbi:MAG: FG-GAP repeat domain-containing protein [Terriglobales bacterium]
MLRRCLLAAAICTLALPARCLGQAPVKFHAVSSPDGPAAFDVVAVDLNNDGLPDIVSSSLDTSPCSITTSLANGDGTFRAPATVYLDAENTTCSVAAADMNADGKADLVVVIPGSNQILVFLGNGDGTFQFQITSGIPIPRGAFFFLNIIAADFNHDGKPDVVVQYSTAFDSAAGYSRYLLLLEGNGAGGFASVRTIFTPSPNTAASDIVVGDFDSNGSADLAFLAPACAADSCPTLLHVLYGNGRLGFLDATPFPDTRFPFLTAGDLNSDGRTDLFGIDPAGKRLVTLYGRKDRTFDVYYSPVSLSGTLGSQSECCAATLAMADFNDDGRMDIVGLLGQGNSRTTEQLVFLLATPNPGKFTTQLVDLPSHQFATNPVVGDFNRDLRPDVLLNEADLSTPSQSGDTGSFLVTALNRTAGSRWSNCNYPRQGQAIALCAPIDITSSPVNFSAAATAFEPLRKIELWVDGNKIDGNKIAQQDHTWTGSAWFNYTTAFSPGAHQGTFFAADIGNGLQQLDFKFTVGDGPCAYPSSPGVSICQPSGFDTSSPVLVEAAANISGTLARMELWVDGVKKYTETTSLWFNTSVYAGTGDHRVDVFAVNTAGTKWLQTVHVTIR